MPRDVDVEIVPDLSYPNLPALAYLLRHPERWHRDFHWEFGTVFGYVDDDPECGTEGCAMGVAAMIWDPDHAHSKLANEEVTDRTLMNWFHISQGTIDRLFYGTGRQHDVSEITPEMIAGRIDDFLAGRPIRSAVAGDRTDDIWEPEDVPDPPIVEGVIGCEGGTFRLIRLRAV